MTVELTKMGSDIEELGLNHRFRGWVDTKKDGKVFVEISVMQVHKHHSPIILEQFNEGDWVFYFTFMFREKFERDSVDRKYFMKIRDFMGKATKDNITNTLSELLDTEITEMLLV